MRRRCQFADAPWHKDILLGADKNEAVEHAFFFAAIRRFDRQSGFADAADVIYEHGPRSIFWAKRAERSFHFFAPPEETRASGKIVGNFGSESLNDFGHNWLAASSCTVFEQESLQII